MVYRVFNPESISIVFKANTFKECMDFKVKEGIKDFRTGSVLMIIRPDDKTFDKTYGFIKMDL